MEENQDSVVTQTHTSTGWVHKIKMWILEYKRVLTVTKKPTKEEYLTVVKISGLGILLIGLLGFAVQMIELMFFK